MRELGCWAGAALPGLTKNHRISQVGRDPRSSSSAAPVPAVSQRVANSQVAMIDKFTTQLSCDLNKKIRNWLDMHPLCLLSHTHFTENLGIYTQPGLWDQRPVVCDYIPTVDHFPATYQTVQMQIP